MGLILFDTCILIDAGHGLAEALGELAYYPSADWAISSITWIEMIVGAQAGEEEETVRFLQTFQILELDQAIAAKAAAIRRHSVRSTPKIALADAIILATAKVHGLTVITRNTRDFKGKNVRIPYELRPSTTFSVVNIAPPP
ncbi:PIN domain-containing protein [Massilia sp. erpn]|uniref:PIN domain-containing protein n=1 Tax=Massilia sp. erpn TaxID=2738142 RepID=UPI00210557E5|nr:PIN domain-containing protein [Massilia sp. erpn]UTY58152.1 PIN domain-containing protein [Massilia sp. erpn]